MVRPIVLRENRQDLATHKVQNQRSLGTCTSNVAWLAGWLLAGWLAGNQTEKKFCGRIPTIGFVPQPITETIDELIALLG